MTTLLGPAPHYVGWLDVGKGGYGFLYRGDKGNVLAAWSPADKRCKAKFDAAVRMTDLAGKQSSLPTGQELVLTQSPVFISDLLADLVAPAQSNVGKPYPWGGDYVNAKVVTCRLAAVNTEDGLKQVNPKTTVVVKDGGESYRRPDFVNPDLKNEGRYVYFRVDPQFVPFGTKELEITIVAKRLSPDKEASHEDHLRIDEGLQGRARLVDDSQGRQVAREHLEAERRQLRRPMGLELPVRCERIAQRVSDQGSAHEKTCKDPGS